MPGIISLFIRRINHDNHTEEVPSRGHAPRPNGKPVHLAPPVRVSGTKSLSKTGPEIAVERFLARVAGLKEPFAEAGGMSGRTMARPCFKELSEKRALPQAVRGPVDFKALARRAAREPGVNWGERRRGITKPPEPAKPRGRIGKEGRRRPRHTDSVTA